MASADADNAVAITMTERVMQRRPHDKVVAGFLSLQLICKHRLILSVLVSYLIRLGWRLSTASRLRFLIFLEKIRPSHQNPGNSVQTETLIRIFDGNIQPQNFIDRFFCLTRPRLYKRNEIRLFPHYYLEKLLKIMFIPSLLTGWRFYATHRNKEWLGKSGWFLSEKHFWRGAWWAMRFKWVKKIF